jgi:hypothetical protein
MNKDAEQRKAFTFLRQRWMDQALFTTEEFRSATGWSDVSFRTYLSKQFKGLLEKVGDKFRVRLNFRKVASWDRFRWDVVSQKRVRGRSYAPPEETCAVVFEFFMPLRNEEWLRSALDGLFFAEPLRNRLATRVHARLVEHFPLREGETSEQHRDRVTGWISEKFGGYSVSHVSGRFRGAPLMTKAKALEMEESGTGRYLIDETTAVVRFIIPCGRPGGNEPGAIKEAEVVRWVFEQFFVQTVLEAVDGEDEVWVMESGLRSRLHRYKAIES